MHISFNWSQTFIIFLLLTLTSCEFLLICVLYCWKISWHIFHSTSSYFIPTLKWSQQLPLNIFLHIVLMPHPPTKGEPWALVGKPSWADKWKHIMSTSKPKTIHLVIDMASQNFHQRLYLSNISLNVFSVSDKWILSVFWYQHALDIMLRPTLGMNLFKSFFKLQKVNWKDLNGPSSSMVALQCSFNFIIATKRQQGLTIDLHWV
jgi:hypothetical protein